MGQFSITTSQNIHSVPVSFPHFKSTIKRPVQEVSIDGANGHAQVVGCLQCVIAIVVMSWIFEIQAALDVVTINVLIDAHIFTVVYFLNKTEKSSSKRQRAKKINK